MASQSGPRSTAGDGQRAHLSRRALLKGAGIAAAGGVVGDAARAAAKSEPARIAGEIEIELSINGKPQRIQVEPRTTLLNALRNHCNPPLTGTKLVCDAGSCGACTVHRDGRPVYSCMLLAVDCVGHEITTIEGLSAPGAELAPLFASERGRMVDSYAGAQGLTEVQRAFCEHDASMCGFCTPGFVMSITALLARKPDASLDEVKHACAGNLCRCGTYPHVFEAALNAGRAIQERKEQRK